MSGLVEQQTWLASSIGLAGGNFTTMWRWSCTGLSQTHLNRANAPLWLGCNDQLMHAQVGAACLADLTSTEEACSGASLQASINASGALCGFTKQGPTAISPDMLLVGFC